jgi:hypothetical protein|tara:strand:- start:203 stop:385 length:183 start_codon:yes stop_codon:yes gene_type:complete
MKALNLLMEERTYSGIMAYREVNGIRGNIRDTAEKMLLELIDSKPELQRATEIRQGQYSK